MTETPPNRRRWFRFSSRTMLLAVAILAVYLAYNAHWIRQRRQFVEDLQRNSPPEFFYISFGNAGHFPLTAPFPLWVFGESGADSISFNLDLGETDHPLSQEEYWQRLEVAAKAAPVTEAIRLFPETRVHKGGYVKNVPPTTLK